MTGTKSKVALSIRLKNSLYINNEVCLNIDSDPSVEVATNGVNVDGVCLRISSDLSVEVAANRVCMVGHRFILSDLKKLARSFGLKLNLCTTRFGRRIAFNRARRQGFVKKSIVKEI